jgi:hypothetical protein
VIGVLLSSSFTACSLFEPENANYDDFDRALRDPAFAEGLLIRAYTFIPTNDYSFDDVATDDAVTNDPFNSYMKMATGEWSAINNPQDLWANSNRAITYINEFLSIVNDVPWKYTDDELNDLYIRRLTGEAYALRGLFKYYNLRNHGGLDGNGQILGLQILDSYPLSEDDFTSPRVGLNEYIDTIYTDFEKALEYLPLDYGNISSFTETEPSFSTISSVDKYNVVFGDDSRQRMSGRHAMAMRARLALLVASPNFNPNNDVSLWERAANYHADLLEHIGWISGLDPKGHIFYEKAQVDNAYLQSGNQNDIPEILWRRPIQNNRTREVENFPPSLFGNGRINPSQNLVDAFPMQSGYPIDNPNSGYDPDNPYTNRDPRLGLYIIHDGSWYQGVQIRTAVGGGVNALDSVVNSTRTGYYLKKLLREDVNANPTTATSQRHFNTHIRYTEIFLNYAEAANEAWGPTQSPHEYSAKDVIAAIRNRAGIQQPDIYLQAITDKKNMQTLIHNERRLELCFEGSRFWDLRRWKKDLTTPVTGVRIIPARGEYNYFTVEERLYDNDYMHYGPIPNNDVVRFGITQNAGW